MKKWDEFRAFQALAALKRAALAEVAGVRGGSVGTDDETCIVAPCDRLKRARGMCAGHYERSRLDGWKVPTKALRARAKNGDLPQCSVEVCSRTASSRTWCASHAAYARLHGYATPTHAIDPSNPKPIGGKK